MNESKEFNYSSLDDDELSFELEKIVANPNEFYQKLLEAEIELRVKRYQKESDEALERQPSDYGLALEKLEQAKFLNNSYDISKRIKEVEKEQEEKKKQSTDLLYNLKFRLEEREDFNTLKKAVEDAEILLNEGALPGELKDIFISAKKIEDGNRKKSGEVTTKARAGNMMESKEGYSYLFDIQQNVINGTTNKTQVWDTVHGVYIDTKSDAFITLLEEANVHWKKETQTAIDNFITDPKGGYKLKLNDDPVFVEASFQRHFYQNGKVLAHPDSAEQLSSLETEISDKSRAYRRAQILYNDSLLMENLVKAYETRLKAFETYNIFANERKVKEIMEIRKRAQGFIIEGLKNNFVWANKLVEKFKFNEYQEFKKSIWKNSEDYKAVQIKDAISTPDPAENKKYAGRLQIYIGRFNDLENKYTEVWENCDRIEKKLAFFEGVILAPNAQNTIDAAKIWEKLNAFLDEESEFLGASQQGKKYSLYFGKRIDSLKKILIPLLGDQQQLQLMKDGEDNPGQWIDILKTGVKLRKKYQEAEEIYVRVYKKSTLGELEASLKADDYVTARKLLNTLYEHDKDLRYQLKDEEDKVKNAEIITTREVEGFFIRATQLAASGEVSNSIEAWKMFRYLTPEFYQEGGFTELPVIAGNCIYTAQSRNNISEIAEWLSQAAKRVTEKSKNWNINDIHKETIKDKNKAKGVIFVGSLEFIKAAEEICLLRENSFLNLEQIIECRPVEIRHAKWLADQFMTVNDFQGAYMIWQKIKLAYDKDGDVAEEILFLKQKELFHKLAEKLSRKDYQGMIDAINEAERENMNVVAGSYQIRLKHAQALEGLKQFENALLKLDDIKPEKLNLSADDIEVVTLERRRLQIESEIGRGIKNYEQSILREKKRHKNSPSYFYAFLIHLSTLKKQKVDYGKHEFLNEYFEAQLNDHVHILEELIKRNKNINRNEIKRDVFLYRLTLNELKDSFAAIVDEDLISFNKDQESHNNQIIEVFKFIEKEFDKVNPAQSNVHFDKEEAEYLLDGPLNAREMAELMQRYHGQFNQLLKLKKLPNQIAEDLKDKVGEAVYMFDRLEELFERAEVEISWEYALRNGFASRSWEAYFNGRTLAYGDSIPVIKKRLSFIQRNLRDSIVEIDEFNNKMADADLIKLEINQRINQITTGYSDYLSRPEIKDWKVSQDVSDILDYESAIPEAIRKGFGHIQEDIYPTIISFYDRTISFKVKEPKQDWCWKGFDECKSKAVELETNFKVWQDWRGAIKTLIAAYNDAHDFAQWAKQDNVTVPWQDEEKADQVKLVIVEKNWYPQVFTTNDSWEVDPSEGERFMFKYKINKPLPKTYQMWLWENAHLKNDMALEAIKKGPSLDLNLVEYPSYTPAAENIKLECQANHSSLKQNKDEIDKIIKDLKKERELFPSLKVLDDWVRNKQYDQLQAAIEKGKEIGPQNKKEADYLRSKESDLKNKSKSGLLSWFK